MKNILILGIIVVVLVSCQKAQDYEYEVTNNGVTIASYVNKHVKEVVIPETIQELPVTAIADEAFADQQLVSVIIPDTVTHIGNNAFRDNLLTSVIIPDSVTHIGNFAFAENHLSSVSLPNGITTITEGAFYSNRLESVSIPDSVTVIENLAFADNKVSSVIIPNSIVSIARRAFENNHITNVSAPYNFVTVGNQVVNNKQFVYTHRTLDNLRLRLDAKPISKHVTTLPPNVLLYILETGRNETIGGITAPWVRVITSSGFTGWCFSGYLEKIWE